VTQLVIAYSSDLFGRFPGVGHGGDYPAISGVSTAFSISVIKKLILAKNLDWQIAGHWSAVPLYFSYIFGSDVSLGAT
jgi:hypothetical protein